MNACYTVTLYITGIRAADFKAGRPKRLALDRFKGTCRTVLR